jgi:hypothetical protein
MIGKTPAGIKFMSFGIARTGSTSGYECLKQYCHDARKHHPRFYVESSLDDHFKFCIVRNPWDRYVSQYYWGKKYGRSLADTFDDFINRLISGKDFNSHIAHPNFSRMQIEWAMDMNNQIDCDYFGRFETMNESWNFIFDKLKLDMEMIHIHGTSHGHYSTYYTPELRDKVHEYALKDIEYFNYKFEDCNE